MSHKPAYAWHARDVTVMVETQNAPPFAGAGQTGLSEHKAAQHPPVPSNLREKPEQQTWAGLIKEVGHHAPEHPPLLADRNNYVVTRAATETHPPHSAAGGCVV